MQKASEDIVDEIRASTDENRRWDLVLTLHKRGTRHELDIAIRLAQSDEEQDKVTAADILGQLFLTERRFEAERIEQLQLLLEESSLEVIYASLIALMYISHPSTIDTIILFSSHDDSVIRCSSAMALQGHENPRAIDALIKLCHDTCRDTRNWATFALGTQIDSKSDAICEALLARTNESDDEIRGEAIVGLARRAHINAFELVIKELQREPAQLDCYPITAAIHIADTRLHSALVRIKEAWRKLAVPDYFMSEIDEAIAACAPD